MNEACPSRPENHPMTRRYHQGLDRPFHPSIIRVLNNNFNFSSIQQQRSICNVRIKMTTPAHTSRILLTPLDKGQPVQSLYIYPPAAGWPFLQINCVARGKLYFCGPPFMRNRPRDIFCDALTPSVAAAWLVGGQWTKNRVFIICKQHCHPCSTITFTGQKHTLSGCVFN